jgi:hypothetical protein
MKNEFYANALPEPGQTEFENLYGPLAEHLYWTPDETSVDQNRRFLTILETFKKRLQDIGLDFLQKQRAGNILNREEAMAKREAHKAEHYLNPYIKEFTESIVRWETDSPKEELINS